MKEQEEDGYHALGFHAQNFLSFSNVCSSYDSLNQFYLKFQDTTPLAKWLVSSGKVDKNHNSASSWKSDSYFELTSERHLKERDHCIGSWLASWKLVLHTSLLSAIAFCGLSATSGLKPSLVSKIDAMVLGIDQALSKCRYI